MNATARKLGLTKTHFSDFSGLPDPGEYTTYSTARDLVSLGRDAMRSRRSRRSWRRAPTGWRPPATTGRTSGATSTRCSARSPARPGSRPGSPRAAGECLLFAAKRGSTALIGVVLDSSAADSPALAAAAADATAMLDWGFSR